MKYEMISAIDELLEKIKEDYFNYTSRYGTRELSDINKKMIAEFNDELGYTVGKKYIKITVRNGGSVWGFVVAGSDKKFQEGDILKAASWATPARNKARGNILEGNFDWVQWTGPAYL